MLANEKNLKDTNSDLSLSVKDSHLSLSYTKSNKLVIAVYMVTDIMDTTEPLRNKLRTLATDIVSDIHISLVQAELKINQIVSFLDIASTMKLVSEMNSQILLNEFLKLKQSLKGFGQVKSQWLEEFLGDPEGAESQNQELKKNSLISFGAGEKNTIRRPFPVERTDALRTRIGVQKGSTLLKALSDKTVGLSQSSHANRNQKDQFEMLKKARREDIVSILKAKPEGLTITDIKAQSKGHIPSFKSVTTCSEKTLQRELVSMVKDNVLNKKGDKRWSKYFVSPASK